MVSFDQDELHHTIANLDSECRWCNERIKPGQEITRVPDWHNLEHIGMSGVWVHSSCIELMEGFDYAMDKGD